MSSPSYGESDTLPAYRRQRAYTILQAPYTPREQTFSISRRDGIPWATLRVNSRSSTSPPLFLEGDSVGGTVELSLPEGESFGAITLSLAGRLESEVSGRYTFLELTKTLYTPDTALSRQSSNSSRLSSTLANSLPFSGASPKLQGDFSWPFSFALPSHVDFDVQLGQKSRETRHALPPSFAEPHARFRIRYALTLRLRRGRLRADSTLAAPLAYVPRSRPDPPSALFQLASLSKLSLRGVAGDPDGWHSFSPATLRGTLFGARAVAVQCTLALARPLCYARGGALPLMARFAAADAQALDLLAAPASCPPVTLLRCTRDPGTSPADGPAAECRTVARATGWRVFVEPGAEPDAERVLSGEIMLPDDLAPTTAFGPYFISYLVVMHPPVLPGFEPARTGRSWLYSEPVRIATEPAAVQGALVAAPPSYAPESGG